MAEKSGFFNALKGTDGRYDRLTDANEFSGVIAAMFSNGVRRSGDDDLKVSAAGGFALKVSPGFAIVNGRWYRNDAEYTAFSVPTPPAGDMGRIDRIAIRLDASVEGREVKLVYLTGTPSQNPVAPELTRSATGSPWEIAIADIRVGAAVSQITAGNITDTRPDKDLCGWITTPVGYDDYFASLDSAFEDWFGETRDKVASVTMYREYHQRITAESTISAVTFSIAQFDPTGVDIVKVALNGLQAVEGIDYTRNGTTITFTTPKVAGTDIDITVVKSIDGTGLGSVQDAVEELQDEVGSVKNIGEYLYICNGYDDNIKLTEIAQNFLTSAGGEGGRLTINVYGTFGANAPYSGDGASTSRYRWMILGSESATPPKRVVFDFLNCSPMTFTGEAGKHYIVIHGNGVEIRNADIVARQRNTEGSIVVFGATKGDVFATRCRFDVSAYQGSNIARTGTFVDCSGTVTNSRGDSFCFDASTDGLLRVRGGEYYAYTGLSSSQASVIESTSTETNAVVFADGVNCPTVAKSAHYQKNACLLRGGKGCVTGTITTLTMSATGGATISGTIALSKPNLG